MGGAAMYKYRCRVCGYILDAQNPPERVSLPEHCPVCGAIKESFILLQPAGKKWDYYFDLFQPGWWLLHLAAISGVYTLGRWLWH